MNLTPPSLESSECPSVQFYLLDTEDYEATEAVWSQFPRSKWFFEHAAPKSLKSCTQTLPFSGPELQNPRKGTFKYTHLKGGSVQNLSLFVLKTVDASGNAKLTRTNYKLVGPLKTGDSVSLAFEISPPIFPKHPE